MDVENGVTQARPPNLISALLAGFDLITNHIGLVLFPVALDLFLWLGPRLQIRDLLMSTLQEIGLFADPGSTENAGYVLASQEFWQSAAARINLFSALRTYPVGLPSLMASELPGAAPVDFSIYQVNTWMVALVIWLGLGLFGILLGSMYFLIIAQVTLGGELNTSRMFHLVPWTYGQIVLLTAVWIILLLLMSIPVSFLLSLILSAGSVFGQILLLISGGFLLWILFPLIYSAHGIFVNRLRVWSSIKKSIQIVQLTLPATALFILAIFVIDQGLGLLWQIPADQSWFMLIGVAGHAFVATALFSATFIYYRDADNWMQAVLRRFQEA
jgi:hypothetical protein